MKRLIAILLCIIFIICLFPSCSKTTVGKGFVMPVSETPDSLDPQIANSDIEKLIIANCFEGLVRIARNGEIENGVAESYTVSSDGLVYTFNLRKKKYSARILKRHLIFALRQTTLFLRLKGL